MKLTVARAQDGAACSGVPVAPARGSARGIARSDTVTILAMVLHLVLILPMYQFRLLDASSACGGDASPPGHTTCGQGALAGLGSLAAGYPCSGNDLHKFAWAIRYCLRLSPITSWQLGDYGIAAWQVFLWLSLALALCAPQRWKCQYHATAQAVVGVLLGRWGHAGGALAAVYKIGGSCPGALLARQPGYALPERQRSMFWFFGVIACTICLVPPRWQLLVGLVDWALVTATAVRGGLAVYGRPMFGPRELLSSFILVYALPTAWLWWAHAHRPLTPRQRLSQGHHAAAVQHPAQQAAGPKLCKSDITRETALEADKACSSRTNAPACSTSITDSSTSVHCMVPSACSPNNNTVSSSNCVHSSTSSSSSAASETTASLAAAAAAAPYAVPSAAAVAAPHLLAAAGATGVAGTAVAISVPHAAGGAATVTSSDAAVLAGASHPAHREGRAAAHDPTASLHPEGGVDLVQLLCRASQRSAELQSSRIDSTAGHAAPAAATLAAGASLSYKARTSKVVVSVKVRGTQQPFDQASAHLTAATAAAVAAAAPQTAAGAPQLRLVRSVCVEGCILLIGVVEGRLKQACSAGKGPDSAIADAGSRAVGHVHVDLGGLPEDPAAAAVTVRTALAAPLEAAGMKAAAAAAEAGASSTGPSSPGAMLPCVVALGKEGQEVCLDLPAAAAEAAAAVAPAGAAAAHQHLHATSQGSSSTSPSASSAAISSTATANGADGGAQMRVVLVQGNRVMSDGPCEVFPGPAAAAAGGGATATRQLRLLLPTRAQRGNLLAHMLSPCSQCVVASIPLLCLPRDAAAELRGFVQQQQQQVAVGSGSCDAQLQDLVALLWDLGEVLAQAGDAAARSSPAAAADDTAPAGTAPHAWSEVAEQLLLELALLGLSGCALLVLEALQALGVEFFAGGKPAKGSNARQLVQSMCAIPSSSQAGSCSIGSTGRSDEGCSASMGSSSGAAYGILHGGCGTPTASSSSGSGAADVPAGRAWCGLVLTRWVRSWLLRCQSAVVKLASLSASACSNRLSLHTPAEGAIAEGRGRQQGDAYALFRAQRYQLLDRAAFSHRTAVRIGAARKVLRANCIAGAGAAAAAAVSASGASAGAVTSAAGSTLRLLLRSAFGSCPTSVLVGCALYALWEVPLLLLMLAAPRFYARWRETILLVALIASDTQALVAASKEPVLAALLASPGAFLGSLVFAGLLQPLLLRLRPATQVPSAAVLGLLFWAMYRLSGWDVPVVAVVVWMVAASLPVSVVLERHAQRAFGRACGQLQGPLCGGVPHKGGSRSK